MVNGMTKEMELEKKEEEGRRRLELGRLWIYVPFSLVLVCRIGCRCDGDSCLLYNEYDAYLYDQYPVAH